MNQGPKNEVVKICVSQLRASTTAHKGIVVPTIQDLDKIYAAGILLDEMTMVGHLEGEYTWSLITFTGGTGGG